MNLECRNISCPSEGFCTDFQAIFSEGIHHIHAKSSTRQLLFKYLTASTPPEKGSILFLDYDIHYLGDAYRNHLCYLSRYPLFPGSFPLYHYFIHISLLQRLPGKYAFQNADYLLKTMGIEHLRNHTLSQIPSSMQNRIRIFQTLLSEAPILIIEEKLTFDSQEDESLAKTILQESLNQKIILFLTEKEDPFPDLPHHTYVIQ